VTTTVLPFIVVPVDGGLMTVTMPKPLSLKTESHPAHAASPLSATACIRSDDLFYLGRRFERCNSLEGACTVWVAVPVYVAGRDLLPMFPPSLLAAT
jgi:hypothetical protein